MATLNLPVTSQTSQTHHVKPRSLGHKLVLFAKNVAIYLVLFGLGVIGAGIIRYAGELAEVPWIAFLGKITLFPVNQGSPTYEGQEHEILSHLFSELGIALFVAAILGATFEFFMRRREERAHAQQVHEVENAALMSLLGYFVPPSISNQVKGVFDEQVMRSNLTVTYAFGPAPSDLQLPGQDLVMVTLTVAYSLVNLTRKPNRHVIDHGFESTLPFGQSYSKFLNLEIKQGKDPKIGWPHGLHAEKVRIDDGSRPWVRTLQVEVDLKPGRKEGPPDKDAHHVTVSHQLIRRSVDQDHWTTWLPADGLKVVAKTAGTPLTLDFHLDKTHPSAFRETPILGDYEWVLIGNPGDTEKSGADGAGGDNGPAVLPYQGFTLYWFPPIQGRSSPGPGETNPG